MHQLSFSITSRSSTRQSGMLRHGPPAMRSVPLSYTLRNPFATSLCASLESSEWSGNSGNPAFTSRIFASIRRARAVTSASYNQGASSYPPLAYRIKPKSASRGSSSLSPAYAMVFSGPISWRCTSSVGNLFGSVTLTSFPSSVVSARPFRKSELDASASDCVRLNMGFRVLLRLLLPPVLGGSGGKNEKLRCLAGSCVRSSSRPLALFGLLPVGAAGPRGRTRSWTELVVAPMPFLFTVRSAFFLQ